MTISKELLDELLKGCERPEDLLGNDGLMKELKIKLMERMLGAELTAHSGYDEGKDAPSDQPDRRNGTANKLLKGQDGAFPIAVPRDRPFHRNCVLTAGQWMEVSSLHWRRRGRPGSTGWMTVRRIRKQSGGPFSRRTTGLYAAGLTVRDIRAHLEEVYGLQVSPDLISRATDAVLSAVLEAVLDEVREWQSRALERMYPIVIFDALGGKVRDAPSRALLRNILPGSGQPYGRERGCLCGLGRLTGWRA
jgi:putative transposase